MDRLVTALTALVRKATEQLFAMRTMPYVVQSCDPVAQTVSVLPLDASMPPLTDVPLRSPGLVMNLPPGTAVNVAVDVGGVPYVQSYASGGIPPLVPGAGSGVQNNIDAGYILITQVLVPQPAVVTAVYFPAGVAGALAAEQARNVAVVAGLAAFLLHMSGGRVLPNGWTVP